MRGHLTQEEITQFTAHLIKGKERVSILTHLEMCAMCRALITAPTEGEILERLAPDNTKVTCDCEGKSVSA